MSSTLRTLLLIGCWLCSQTVLAQNLPVYTDGLLNDFQNYSYSGGSDFNNPSPFHDGAPSIAFTGNAQFNAVSFAHPAGPFSTANYSGIRLFVHGGATGGQKLVLFLQQGEPSVSVLNGGSVPLDGFVSGGSIVANSWVQVDIPFGALSFNNGGSFDRIDLQTGAPGGSQPVMYLDDVILLAGNAVDPLFANGFEGGGAALAGQLSFSSASYNVNENAAVASITVQRNNGNTGAVSVQYATSNGSAIQPGDYASSSGMLAWLDGDSASKSFNVPIVDDALDEGNETVNLTLSGSTGGAILAAPSNAVLTIIDNDAAPPPCSLQVQRDVSVDGMLSDRFSWCDATDQPRQAVLAHNDQNGPGGSRGGELREFRYQVAGNTRIVRSSGSAASGFGYIVSHPTDNAFCTGAGDSSSLGHFTAGNWTRIFEGRHHAIFRFTQNYPRYCTTDAPATNYPLPVTIDWLISSGRDHPLWAVSFDLQAGAIPMNRLRDDARAPYGELLFDGAATAGAHSTIAGVGWGERYKFSSTTAPLRFSSSWTWNQLNSVPYVKLWTTAVDATMGTVQTQTMSQHDAGGYFGIGNWRTTSAQGNACVGQYLMPCDFNWPYQSVNYSLLGANGSTFNTRLAWGSNFGFLGQVQYPVMGSADNAIGGPVGNGNAANNPYAFESRFATGWPRQSYSTFVVLGTHSSDPVGAQISQIETVQTTSLSAATGTVTLTGPAGVARPDTITYSPVGWNPVYAAWAVAASANQIDVNFSVGSGTLGQPLLIVSNWTLATLPSVVRFNGGLLLQDVDYFPSVRAGTQELWITLDRGLAGAANRVEILP